LGSYRSRLDIIADILRVASGNAKKTQIMYQANLSYKVLTRYLTEINDAFLIAYETEKQYYVITDKGREFLEAYTEYFTDNECIEKQLNAICDKRKVLEALCSSK
jgi:predicted transcriptional regulator